MKTFYKITLGLLVLACSIFSCKNDWPLPGSMHHHPSSAYGSVTTIHANLPHIGPMAVDKALNFYYIPYNLDPSDTTGIYKVTPAGVTSLLAGGPLFTPVNGTGPNARFGFLDYITLGWDNVLYVDEFHFAEVRKVTLDGVATTLGPAFQYDQAFGLKLADDGNLYVISSPRDNFINILKPDGTSHILVDGGQQGYQDGPVASATFSWMTDLAICHDSTVFVADSGNHAIRKIKSGIVSTFKTGIVGVSLQFDSSGNLYVGEATKITKITPDGVVSTLAGSNTIGSSDGVGSAATFSGPLYLAINKDVLYVADVGNKSIRKVVIK